MLIDSYSLEPYQWRGSLPRIGAAPWCMIPSTLGSNPGGSGDEPDGVTNTQINTL